MAADSHHVPTARPWAAGRACLDTRYRRAWPGYGGVEPAIFPRASMEIVSLVAASKIMNFRCQRSRLSSLTFKFGKRGKPRPKHIVTFVDHCGNNRLQSQAFIT